MAGVCGKADIGGTCTSAGGGAGTGSGSATGIVAAGVGVAASTTSSSNTTRVSTPRTMRQTVCLRFLLLTAAEMDMPP